MTEDSVDTAQQALTEPFRKRLTRRKVLAQGGTAAIAAVAGVVGGQLVMPPPAGVHPVTYTVTGPTQPVTVSGPVTTATLTQTITSTVVGGPSHMIFGAVPAERAVNAIRTLREQGKIPAGTRIRLLETLSRVANLTPVPGTEGPGVQEAVNVLELWESQTGIPVDLEVLNGVPELYEKAIEEAASQAGTWDVMSQPIDFLADFIAADAITDATTLEETYGGDFEAGPCPVIPTVARAYRTTDGKLWGVPGRGDWFNLYVRHDLMLNKLYRREFESEFGYPMPVGDVQLWDQILDLAKFFDGREPGLRGGYYFRDPFTSHPEFYIRLWELGGLYMDDVGRVILDHTNQFGVNALRTALEDMKKLVAYQSADAFSASYEGQRSEYGQKRVVSTVSPASFAQWAALEPVGAQGIGVYHVPGYVTGGKLIRVTGIWAQTSYVLAKWGKLTQRLPDIPYLFLQWLSDPSVSAMALANPGANSDPFRTCHSSDPRLIRAFGAGYPPSPESEPGRRGAMETFDLTLRVAAPPLQLLGLKEIQDLQGREMYAYFTDRQTLATTAQNIQQGVQAIIDGVGRDREIPLWRRLLDNFPEPLKALHGIEGFR